MHPKARIFVALAIAGAAAAIAASVYPWRPGDAWRFGIYLILSILAAGMRLRIPGVPGTTSACFLFSLIGIAELPLGEAVVVSCLAASVHYLWKARSRPRATQIILSVAVSAMATAIVYRFYHWPVIDAIAATGPFLMMVAAVLYLALTSVPLAASRVLGDGRPLGTIWREALGSLSLYIPLYILGASIAWIVNLFSRRVNWQTSVLVLPIVYFIQRSYRAYQQRLADEKSHVEEMAGLHLRTIEALALAIEAKDHTTSSHLRRVRVYAVEIGKDLGLSGPELEALRAASLLHDIGKLAIPEHIVSKPGRLTPEEFEKMKIHPLVGAEILERVSFPYPVAPLVRAHHERWDGSGYPYGLKGEQIPLGARILAAVDCLDALSSDRQYRRALPLDEAMLQVSGMSGKSLDPLVVAVLGRRYRELEQMAQAQASAESSLSTGFKIGNGMDPAPGLPGLDAHAIRREGDFLACIAAARQEAQLVFELTQDLGNSLSLDETLTVVSPRLKKMVPYDAIAVYVSQGNVLVPHYVNGDSSRLLSSLEIPFGEGLSGWVAAHRKSIVNGNPALEAACLNDPAKPCTLRSALAVPLAGVHGVIGVLTLYRTDKNAFSRDHLRILLAITAKISLAIENALRFQLAEDSATTDYLTLLPNARSLFLRLDSELARCRRTLQPLTVLVCDVDGFKQVNDRFGHLEGNKVLRYLAEALRENCREYDYVARMGGDEFVILLPGSDREAVYRRITEFQSVACDAAGLVSGAGVITLSVGEAFYPEDGSDAEQLLAEADRRMYKSKHLNKARRTRGIHLLPAAQEVRTQN
ncbi:MAG TPA: HD domain-containing phosphohydrolase [Bryobacteraceae bacterium]|jgi:diguanylate cyclase (GGDEF)-like protein/putative nucleotidyltransferase with HDIG domain|nr:HD domain-containing phosphohydrolase [Bryobacteraceae bacterium]